MPPSIVGRRRLCQTGTSGLPTRERRYSVAYPGRDNDAFENVAKELECDESEDALDKAMDGLKVKTPEAEPEKGSTEED